MIGGRENGSGVSSQGPDAEGNVSSIAAVNLTTGNQTGRYAYGTTLAASQIARADLLRAGIYLDSDDAVRRIATAYEVRGMVATITSYVTTGNASNSASSSSVRVACRHAAEPRVGVWLFGMKEGTLATSWTWLFLPDQHAEGRFRAATKRP